MLRPPAAWNAVRGVKVRGKLMSALGDGRAEGKAIGKSRRPGPLTMFARGFLKNPVMVGSVIPSSRFLIEKILAPVNWGRADVFVEFGPGVGTITKPIL